MKSESAVLMLGYSILVLIEITRAANFTVHGGLFGGDEFACNSEVILQCIFQPGIDPIIWQIDKPIDSSTDIAARCSGSSCLVNSDYAGQYSFTYDRSSGISNVIVFNATLNDTGTQFFCEDGLSSPPFDATVQVPPDEFTTIITNSSISGTDTNIIVSTGCVSQTLVTQIQFHWLTFKEGENGSMSYRNSTNLVISEAPCTTTSDCVADGSAEISDSFRIEEDQNAPKIVFQVEVILDDTSLFKIISTTTFQPKNPAVENGIASGGPSPVIIIIIGVLIVVVLAIGLSLFAVLKHRPDPPTNFHITEILDTSISVTWIPGSNRGLKQRFYLCYKEENALDWIEEPSIDETNQEYTLHKLKPLTSYVIIMHAKTRIRRANAMEKLTIRTCKKLEPPKNFKCCKVLDKSISVTWTPGFDGGLPQTFHLQYKKETENKWTKEPPINDTGAQQEYAIEKLKALTVYEIELYAKTRVGVAKASTNLTIKTYGLPEEPQNFSCCINEVTDTTVPLTWNTGFNGGLEQTFHLSYKEKENTSARWLPKPLISDDGPKMKYILQNLKAGTLYEVTLHAQNDIGNSKRVPTLQVQTESTKPPKQLRYDDDSMTDSSVLLTWEKGCSDLNQNFILSYKTKKAETWEKTNVDGNPGAIIKYRLNKLQAGSEYQVKVRTQINHRESRDTKELVFHTHGLIEPPKNLNCDNNSTTDTSVTLTWERGYSRCRDQEFILNYKKNQVNTWEQIHVKGKPDPTIKHKLSKLQHSSAYLVKVRSKNDDGETGDTKEILFRTRELIEPPKNLRYEVKSITDTSVMLTWEKGFSRSPNQNFTLSYKRRHDTCTTWVEKHVDGNPDAVIKYTLDNILPGTEYLAKVRSKNNDGETGDTKEILFHTQGTQEGNNTLFEHPGAVSGHTSTT